MSDVKGHRRPNASSRTGCSTGRAAPTGSHRRSDITEPVSERVMAVWTAARLATLR